MYMIVTIWQFIVIISKPSRDKIEESRIISFSFRSNI